MVVSALHSGATGLEALSTKLDVIANNLANVNTVGFKRSRANFEDLLYQMRRQPGVENSQGDITPTGIMIGSGVRTSGTELMLDQGGLDNTGRLLDLAIDGQGFFQVRIFPIWVRMGLVIPGRAIFSSTPMARWCLATATGSGWSRA